MKLSDRQGFETSMGHYFSKIQTSDGHYSCIISLENNTVIGHYFSTKLNSIIEIPHRSKV